MTNQEKPEYVGYNSISVWKSYIHVLGNSLSILPSWLYSERQLHSKIPETEGSNSIVNIPTIKDSRMNWTTDWVNEWMNEQMKKQRNERINKQTTNLWTNEWPNEWTNEWMAGWLTDRLTEMNEWMLFYDPLTSSGP